MERVEKLSRASRGFLYAVTMTGITGQNVALPIRAALGVFSFLPLCQLHRGNIIVDTFTTRLPRSARNALDALWDLV